MPNDELPEWERVLSSAAHLQELLPGAVLVGGTAAAVHAGHRLSQDADHVLTDLRSRFDAVLAELESVAGWQMARMNRPVQILGSLDGIETGIRQLIRAEPLETMQIEEIEEVWWEDLMPECLWKFRVKDFGPLIVAIDSHGNSQYRKIQERAAARIAALDL